MGRYAIRRLLQLIPVLFGTTFIIYWLVWSLPGDPLAGKCGEKKCPDSAIQLLTEQYHLNDPLWMQYFKYIGNILRGDFGVDFHGTDVLDTIVQVYPVTIRLAII